MFLLRRDPGTDGVGVAFTSAALDLGDAPGAPARTAAFAALADALGVPVAVVSQVHGADVAHVRRPHGASGLVDLTAVRADALVTGDEGLALAVRVADCVPVLFADPDAGVVAAAHAGRRGLVAGVLAATVHAMRDLGAQAPRAWLGPHLCAGCYEVPDDLAAEFASATGVPVGRTRWGTAAIDQRAAALAQLAALGVAVEDVSACTLEHAGLHSHRRDAVRAGRQAGVVWRDRRAVGARLSPGGSLAMTLEGRTLAWPMD